MMPLWSKQLKFRHQKNHFSIFWGKGFINFSFIKEILLKTGQILNVGFPQFVKRNEILIAYWHLTFVNFLFERILFINHQIWLRLFFWMHRFILEFWFYLIESFLVGLDFWLRIELLLIEVVLDLEKLLTFGGWDDKKMHTWEFFIFVTAVAIRLEGEIFSKKKLFSLKFMIDFDWVFANLLNVVHLFIFLWYN